MENIENLLNIYEQLRSCTNPDEMEELKRNFKGSFRIKKRKKESDRDSCKNVGSKELGIGNVGKSRMSSVADKSREVNNLISEAKELAEIGKLGEDLTIEVHEEMQVQFPMSNLVGDKFASYIHEITDLLTKNKAWTIGVWGMGGVGKTTLIKHLHNMMLDKPQIYGFVYWITVSKDCSIQKLQNDVAKRIRESISELDESQRAGILVEALKRKKKFVLILDDIWSDFDSNEVGLGFPKEIGCRLIVTSRSKDVCLKMYCDNIIEVDPLSPKDARTLFGKSIGRGIPDDLTEISIDVLNECAGLPLGIITLAKSMIGCNDVCEWRNVLDELKNSSKIDDMEEKVFNVLRLSYERLKDWKIKECLLYCATYPEDYQIEINELIWLFINAGLLGKNVGMAKMFDKGLAILRKLERAALLSIERVMLSEDSGYVRLHDLIRDMTLQIAGSSFMIKAGIGSKGILDEESWTDKLEVVSLMENQIVEISDLSPKCNRLSALLLQKIHSLSVVCDGFFRYLDGLKLLDLSYSCIKTLPESISLLKNLTALILTHCHMLENVPSLAELRFLERLNLCQTSTSQLPEGIGSLIKLRYLNLYHTRIEKIGVGVISKLTALQYLAIDARIDVNELNSLNNLEHLIVVFEDFVSFSTFIQQMKSKRRPNFYRFFVGYPSYKYIPKFEVAGTIWCVKHIHLRNAMINQYDRLRRITFDNDSLGYSIVDDIQLLDIYDDEDVMSLGDFVFGSACNVQRQSQIERGFKPFSNLKCLQLCNCPNLKKLFPLGLLSNLQNIEEIYIGSCEGLEELTEEAHDETKSKGITNPKTLSLPKLKYIFLRDLPNLKRLCRDDQVIRILLGKITVVRCLKLKRMPLELDGWSVLLPKMVYSKKEKEWFQSLEWDPPESKSKMYFCQV